MRTDILAIFAAFLVMNLSGCASTASPPSRVLTNQTIAGQNDGNPGGLISTSEAGAAASTLTRAL